MLLVLELVPYYSTALAGAVVIQYYCKEQVLLLLIELVPYYYSAFAGALVLQCCCQKQLLYAVAAGALFLQFYCFE
jgi:hypothetical protein